MGMETVGFNALETLSCGTPFLAANAQGFAMHLDHGVNARLFTPQDPVSFDKELGILMATKQEGSWSREALRASMEKASIEHCTDRALRAYSALPPPNFRWLRMGAIHGFFMVNWLVLFAIN